MQRIKERNKLSAVARMPQPVANGMHATDIVAAINEKEAMQGDAVTALTEHVEKDPKSPVSAKKISKKVKKLSESKQRALAKARKADAAIDQQMQRLEHALSEPPAAEAMDISPVEQVEQKLQQDAPQIQTEAAMLIEQLREEARSLVLPAGETNTSLDENMAEREVEDESMPSTVQTGKRAADERPESSKKTAFGKKNRISSSADTAGLLPGPVAPPKPTAVATKPPPLPTWTDKDVASKPHEILGIDEKSDVAEIDAARKRMALRYHPDRNTGNANASKLFMQVVAAATSMKLRIEMKKKGLKF
jgi:hypothetical protein